MPSVKIVDLRPDSGGELRREMLYVLSNDHEVQVTRIAGKHPNYYAIIGENQMDAMTNEVAKEGFRSNDYEIRDPPESNALKSVWVKDLDRQIE